MISKKTLQVSLLKTVSKAKDFDTQTMILNINKKYSESHRHYHNLIHINDCLEQLRFLTLSESESTIIELAIWFHDIIYNPESETNEEDSSNYFKYWGYKLNISGELILKVQAFILSTKNHQADDNDLLKEFLDIDLSIFGMDWDKFKQYDENIRKEYSFVSDAVYYPKRTQILQEFLNKTSIYQSPIFNYLYENKARNNLFRRLKKNEN